MKSMILATLLVASPTLVLACDEEGMACQQDSDSCEKHADYKTEEHVAQKNASTQKVSSQIQPLTQAKFGSAVSPVRSDEKYFEGVVTDVCSKKGCWMKIKTSNGVKKVSFKDYGFFVPTSLIGKSVKLNATESENGKELVSSGVEVNEITSSRNIAR